MDIRYRLKNKLESIVSHGLFYKKIIIFLWNIYDVNNILSNYYHGLHSKHQDVLDYKSVLAEKYGALTGNYRGNNFYGIEFVIKRYARIKSPIPACIEHGVYFGSYVNECEVNESGLPIVVTMSDNRRDHIRKKYDKPVLSVGPYISYAVPMLDKDVIFENKKKLGRTLLVFPVHSTEFVNAQYESMLFIDEIKKIKKIYEFNTVFICLYFKDILNGSYKIYEKQGFKIITAGYRENKYFLDRLRTYIELSDMTMSNAVGTHIGYAISLNKGHYLYNQQCDYKETGIIDNGLALAEALYDDNMIEKNELKRAFSVYSEIISKEQRDVVNKYWGLSLKKTPEQLYEIFTNFSKYIKLDANDKYYSSIVSRELGEYYRKYFY